jgi:hypothetical protein
MLGERQISLCIGRTRIGTVRRRWRAAVSLIPGEIRFARLLVVGDCTIAVPCKTRDSVFVFVWAPERNGRSLTILRPRNATRRFHERDLAGAMGPLIG